MNIIKNLYINWVFYLVMLGVVSVFVVGFFFPAWLVFAQPVFLGVLGVLLIDIFLLFSQRNGVIAERKMMDKLSNGDINDISVELYSGYVFPVMVEVLDELPVQFQLRDKTFLFRMTNGEERTMVYSVRPTKRGEYHWGSVNVYVQSPIGFIKRRFRFSQDKTVSVYPSFMQMRKYEFLAISNRLREAGIKKIRSIGRATEFEQIKDYTPGDDFRTINWKASARRDQLMVNQYINDRSQNVYSVIDMGRLMQMPFNGLSLLDYAINSSLVMSNIARIKDDKAGLICFSHEVHTLLKASNRNAQMRHIQEILYNQKTGYLETDYQRLYARLRQRVTNRSLLLLYTNFESITALYRQLPFLRRMAKEHLVVVIFFENTELTSMLSDDAHGTEEIYNKIVAEKFAYEKRQIKQELRKYGIQAVLSTPEDLTVNSINKYLELKARGYI